LQGKACAFATQGKANAFAKQLPLQGKAIAFIIEGKAKELPLQGKVTAFARQGKSVPLQGGQGKCLLKRKERKGKANDCRARQLPLQGRAMQVLLPGNESVFARQGTCLSK
jgi:hypothetical protein